MIQSKWNPEIDQKGQNYDTFLVKFETTLDGATLLTVYTESNDW